MYENGLMDRHDDWNLDPYRQRCEYSQPPEQPDLRFTLLEQVVYDSYPSAVGDIMSVFLANP